MDDRKKIHRPEKEGRRPSPRKEEHGDRERKIDEQIEQSFPASDPPSYSQPGNDDIEKDG